MINVWCVCVGDKYTAEQVANLARMVRKNLPLEHQFNCLTESDLPGWWAKITLHKKAAPGPNIYLDLDTVVVGDLTPLISFATHPLAMTKNWSRSGHGGYQSSFMAFNGSTRHIAEGIDPSKIGEPQGSENCRNWGYYDGTLWGDQEYLSHFHYDEITEIPPGLVISYKYHCLPRPQCDPPKSAIVVAFHGKPDYWELNHEWIETALS